MTGSWGPSKFLYATIQLSLLTIRFISVSTTTGLSYFALKGNLTLLSMDFRHASKQLKGGHPINLYSMLLVFIRLVVYNTKRVIIWQPGKLELFFFG